MKISAKPHTDSDPEIMCQALALRASGPKRDADRRLLAMLCRALRAHRGDLFNALVGITQKKPGGTYKRKAAQQPMYR